MHVHDPGSSVLEVGLWDRGDDGGLPLSVAGVFRGGGEEMVGTARVPLPRVSGDCAGGMKVIPDIDTGIVPRYFSLIFFSQGILIQSSGGENRW